MTAAILAVTILFLFTPKIASAAVVLNEIMANAPSGEKEWVELYNTSSTINASGWIIEEKTGPDLSGTKQHPLPDFTLQSNGFWTFDFTVASLNNSGDTITLKDNSGTIIDTYQYSSSTQNKTFGRQPDGGSWTSNLNPSKNSSNGGSIPSPAPTPFSSSTPSTTSTSSSFTISNTPSQINSDQSFNISISLSLPNNPNANFYLKGAFKKADSSNYFGLTKVGADWIKNSSTYSSQYKITTDSSGNWSGSLEVKADPDDKGYTGTDDYIFKVGKYNSTDSSPSVSWSDNESNIKIISTESDNQGSAPINNPSSPSNPSTSSQPIKTKTTASNQAKNYDTLVYHNASVAAATTSANSSTSSAEVEVKNQRQTSPLVWIGLIFIFAGAGTVGYIYLKKNAKIHIPFRK